MIKYYIAIATFFIFNLEVFAQQSVLSSGEWYKISTFKDGVHKVTYQDLVDNAIINAPLPSHQLALFGNGPGMLPEENWIDRPVDLQQIKITVNDGGDGEFGPSDYLLFWGTDQITWTYREAENQFVHSRNFYDDKTYYFLTTTWVDGLRINSTNFAVPGDANFVYSFTDYQLHEIEAHNFHKSGKLWFGENFENQSIHEFSFNFPNLVTGSTVLCNVDVVARTTGVGNVSTFNCAAANANVSFDVNNVSSNYLNDVVRAGQQLFDFNPTTPQISVLVEFVPFNQNSKAWINFIAVNAERQLIVGDEQLLFRTTQGMGENLINTYFIQGVNALHQIWDVTNFNNPVKITGSLYQGNFQFQSGSNSIKEYVCFNVENTFQPEFLGSVTNQNLKGQPFAQGFIITHPDFVAQANQLAAFHEQASGLSVNVATTEQIYNEFSGGTADITALRDYLRFFYNNATEAELKPQYLTLLGDASYDYKGLLYPGSSFVPTFQSLNSFALITSYCSDDYFGLLDDNESNALGQLIDLGIGRLPAKSASEAQLLVDKIITYKTEEALGSWQNKVLFVADDEDNNLHMGQSNQLAANMQDDKCELYIQKLFFDAFEQITIENGTRYPEASENLINSIESGLLLVNYTGHSGHSNWASEVVLSADMISEMQNGARLPVFFMANCEFSKFDAPQLISGSELMMLNPNGGAIACISNARVGYSSSNYVFNNHFNNSIFLNENGTYQRLGDLIKNAKIASVSPNIMNHRSVNLMGDPMLKLNYPKNQIAITHFDGNSVETASLDINFASTVLIEGRINNFDGNINSNFNGNLEYLILDKPVPIITLANDGGNSFEFTNWQDTIAYGEATITNGEFALSAYIQNNGSEWNGNGKMNFYAKSGMETATGCLANLNVFQSPVGIESVNEMMVEFFPNPVKSSLNIQVDERSAASFEVRITDSKGNLVYNRNHQNTGLVVLPFENYSSGFYLVELKAEGGRKTVKVIKP
jgi:hypothetical protein